MLLVGLTGGIGSGKTTVARMLESRGAVVYDADLLAREAVEPGTPGYERVVERFGPNVLEPGGGVDREALAAVVFADPAARRDLEAILHPEIRRLFAESAGGRLAMLPNARGRCEEERVLAYEFAIYEKTGTDWKLVQIQFTTSV